jgi:hypothetical protein
VVVGVSGGNQDELTMGDIREAVVRPAGHDNTVGVASIVYGYYGIPTTPALSAALKDFHAAHIKTIGGDFAALPLPILLRALNVDLGVQKLGGSKEAPISSHWAKYVVERTFAYGNESKFVRAVVAIRVWFQEYGSPCHFQFLSFPPDKMLKGPLFVH